MSPTWESTGVKNLSFAATRMEPRDFRQASAAPVDGLRYNVRTLFHLLEQRFYDRQLPGATLLRRRDAIAQAAIDRVRRPSSLWAHFDFLPDAIAVDSGTSTANVFKITRHPSHQAAHTNVCLHPVVRHYHLGVPQSTRHVLEDLLGMYGAHAQSGTVRRLGGVDMGTYHRGQHTEPLRASFAATLYSRAVAAAASGIRGWGVGSKWRERRRFQEEAGRTAEKDAVRGPVPVGSNTRVLCDSAS